MNCWVVSGNIGNEPEFRVLSDGKKVCNFSLAIDTEKRDEPAQWVRVSAWDRQADFVERFLGKGRKVLIQGRVQVREYDHDGVKRTAVEVVANKIDFMDSKPSSGDSAPRQSAPSTARQSGGIDSAARTKSQPKHRTVDATDYHDDEVPF